MGWVRIGLAAGLLLPIVSAGCQSKMYDQNKALYDENKALRDQNEHLKQQQAVAQQPAMPAQPSVPTNPPADTQAAIQQPSAPDQPEQIGGLETTVNKAAGTTTVHLPSDVFFDPGQATLKQSAKASLDKVVAALKKRFAAKKVVVEGHTDSAPIRVSKWESNQTLSEARAQAVKDYVVAHGIEPSRVSIRGYGDTRPRGSDMAKNRRVEIVVKTGS